MITTTRARLAIAGAAITLLLSFAANARCADWIGMQFTAPADVDPGDGSFVSGVGRYRVEAWNGSSWDSVRIYQTPGVEGVPVQPAGSAVRLWVSQTVQPLTSRTYRVVAIDARGNRAPQSNFFIVATGFPDTLVGLSRPAIAIGQGFKHWGGTPLAWTIHYGDSAEIHAAHQEEIQRAESRRICELYAYWMLRGLQVVCP